MHKTIAAIMLAAATFSLPAFSDDWGTCFKNVKSWMWAQGMCGASNCLDDRTGKNLTETTVAKCGWPTFPEKERREFVAQAVEESSPPWAGWIAPW